jgi:hypothetical protein
MHGYEGKITDQRSFANNLHAYEAFAYALDHADMAATPRKLSASAGEERGTCATGRHYTFDIIDNGDQTLHLWTTTCNASRGTLTASANDLRALFDAQIPDLNDVLRGSSL